MELTNVMHIAHGPQYRITKPNIENQRKTQSNINKQKQTQINRKRPELLVFGPPTYIRWGSHRQTNKQRQTPTQTNTGKHRHQGCLEPPGVTPTRLSGGSHRLRRAAREMRSQHKLLANIEHIYVFLNNAKICPKILRSQHKLLAYFAHTSCEEYRILRT